LRVYPSVAWMCRFAAAAINGSMLTTAGMH
jgi:hypothetical protein